MGQTETKWDMLGQILSHWSHAQPLGTRPWWASPLSCPAHSGWEALDSNAIALLMARIKVLQGEKAVI